MAEAEPLVEAVGVVVVGHGRSASALLSAAEGIVGDVLAGVVAVDANVGEDADLRTRMCAAVVAADRGAGVLLIADMFGASPCTCGIRVAEGHPLAVLAGLNLAMLLKLATLDRRALSPAELAEACASSARRAIAVTAPKPPQPPEHTASKEPA